MNYTCKRCGESFTTLLDLIIHIQKWAMFGVGCQELDEDGDPE